jgi:surfeit locus 1 family protein
LIVPGLAALSTLALLLGLGTWQLSRLHWKTELLARIDAAEAAPAAALGAAPPEPFTRLMATGRFDHGREALLGLEVRNGVLGAHLLTPLLRDGAAPLLVDRGWVPLERAGPIRRPDGLVAVTGFVRPADERGSFAARDDPAGRRFYTFDPAAIARALDLPGVPPFGLVALAGPDSLPEALPLAARAIPRPNNPHLGYAVTWYGLAIALLGVFIAFAHRRLKEAPPP